MASTPENVLPSANWEDGVTYYTLFCLYAVFCLSICLFFRNLILGEESELKNSFLHLDWEAEKLEGTRNANENVSKCNTCTLDCTFRGTCNYGATESEPSEDSKRAV